jgi:hypothetical protein
VSDHVTVSNLALAKVGEPYRILDPNEDTPPGADDQAAVRSVPERATLRKGKFNFSMRRAELAAQAPTDPNYLLPYPFQPVPDARRVPAPGRGARPARSASRPTSSRAGRSSPTAPGRCSSVRLRRRRGRQLRTICLPTRFAAKLGFEIADVLITAIAAASRIAGPSSAS